MKTHILAVATFSMLLFSSCQREQAMPSAPLAVTGSPKYIGDPQMKYKLERNAEGDDKCPNSGSNCSKKQFLLTAHVGSLQLVLNAIRTGDQALIQSTFSAEKPTLAFYMADQDINNVILGVLQATTSFNASENTHFILVRTSNDERAYRVEFP